MGDSEESHVGMETRLKPRVPGSEKVQLCTGKLKMEKGWVWWPLGGFGVEGEAVESWGISAGE